MKGEGSRNYKSYRLCSNAEKDKRQRLNAWMLHQRDAITTDNDAGHKIINENIQILEALEGTITDHKLKGTNWRGPGGSTTVLNSHHGLIRRGRELRTHRSTDTCYH